MTKNSLDLLWAKKSVGVDGMPKWLPLKQHLMDAKFIAIMLFRFYLSDNQRQIIKKSIDSDDDESVEQVIKFIASVHDIGKATPAFQCKENYNHSKDLDVIITNQLIEHGYFNNGDTYLPEGRKSPHALAGETILHEFGINDDINAIVGGHHGKTIDDEIDVEDQVEYYSDNYYFDEDSTSDINKKWHTTQFKLINWALSACGYDNRKAIPKINDISAQVILEGLLVMADWIASNERYFPLFYLDQTQASDLNSRLQNGWMKWFNTYQWEPIAHYNVNKYYQERFGFDPNPLQNKLFHTINKTENPGITIIESGMGSGKTEAALATVEQVAQKNGNNGLFFCLPTQASTNAMFNRIKDWADSISTEADSDISIQLVHGKAALNDKFASLSHDIGRDEEAANVLVNEWFSGKKTAILDDFVVGTIDQLLLLALKQKHLALRHLGFSKKVVVIDEAHSFDTYMQQYLYRALDWLGKYHIPVVILSATLPVVKRKQMMESYLNNNDFEFKTEKQYSYPLITYSDGPEVKQINGFKQEESKEISVVKFDEKSIIPKLDELLSDGGIVGIIVNTVKRAQQFATDLIHHFDSDEIEVLHSSFLSNDRMEKEKELLNTIGKNGERPYRKIIIGTQVLEQSLDIDFDVMFSDLAPMDLLIQRLGRLQRHRINDSKRPKKLTTPTLYVLQTNLDNQFESGASAIYGDYLLMRTQYYLPDKFILPQSIAKLVQKVYDDKQLNLNNPDDIDMDINKSLDYYFKVKNEYNDWIQIKDRRAQDYMIKPYNKMSDNLIGWLDDDIDSEAKGLAQVRDSEDSVEVIVVKELVTGGYTILDNGDNDDISNKIDHPKIVKKLAKNTLKLPNVLSKIYNIDNTIDELEQQNRRKLSSWQQKPLLRGSLGIILDQNNQAHLNGYLLSYHDKLGLMYEYERDEND